ncbi:hypothetical protein DFS34DRAFT_447133 [Phlyctochytrium arcticum]|nr:hypothetical protein DFS34DRAFT_447133 [Phlyctochytrium arcticum]
MDLAPKAVGHRNSAERIRQVDILWRLNLPDLFIHIDRSQESEWRTWAMNLKTGKNYYASAMALASPVDKRRRQYLKTIAPASAVDDAWLDDPDQVKAAISARVRLMMAGLPVDFYTPDNQQRRSRDYWAIVVRELDTRPKQEGRLVSVWADGRLFLRWTNPAGDNIEFVLRCSPEIAPSLPNDRRFVRFLQKGIGLRNEDGQLLIPTGTDDDQLGVFPRRIF